MMQATMRINTLIFCIILGLLTGFMLFALGLASAGRSGNHLNLIVALIGVFLPGYAAGWQGALMGLLWGALIGSVLGGGTRCRGQLLARAGVKHVRDSRCC